MNKPLLRTRLTLNPLDERIVPDGGGSEPPTSSPPQEGEPSIPTTVLGAGQTLLVEQVGPIGVYLTNDSDTGNWVTVVDTTTHAFTSVPLDIDPALFQPPTEASPNYQPDPTKPTLVWDSLSGTLTGLPAGTASLPVGTGLFDGTHNIVYTNAGIPAAGPVRLPGSVGGGWTIAPHPQGNGFVFTDPLGNQYVFRVIPPNTPGELPGILFQHFPWSGGMRGRFFQVPPPSTPEPPILPKLLPKKMVMFFDVTPADDPPQ